MAVVGFGVFVAADDLMVVATMLRPMIDDFGLSVPDDLDDAAWIVNTYLVAYVAIMPIAGRLSDLVGRRTVFTAALALFAAGSVVVPAADSLAVLYLGRAMTAVGGGALVPVALAVAADLYRGPARVRALGLLAAVETIGWVWGPLYGAMLVRYLSWRWQFHLNVGLAAVAAVVAWRLLGPDRAPGDGDDRYLARPPGSPPGRRLDWAGPVLLTVGLIALGVALLSGAGIQTVSGLEELTGSGGPDRTGPWLYGVAAVALVGFVLNERRAADPMIGRWLLGSPAAVAALVVNLLVSIGLVIALINVPLFVNIVEGDVERSAVLSGWLLTAFTLTMAVTSYVGGLVGGSSGWRPITTAGLAVGAVGLVIMGLSWGPQTGSVAMAVELAVAGAGTGLVLAPTSAVVVDAATNDQRGVASGLVILARLIGFSVGLAALTAWGLRRYDAMRADVELPPLTDPGYADAVADATTRISTSALAETFLGGGLALVVAAGLTAALRGRAHRHRSSAPALNQGRQHDL